MEEKGIINMLEELLLKHNIKEFLGHNVEVRTEGFYSLKKSANGWAVYSCYRGHEEMRDTFRDIIGACIYIIHNVASSESEELQLYHDFYEAII